MGGFTEVTKKMLVLSALLLSGVATAGAEPFSAFTGPFSDTRDPVTYPSSDYPVPFSGNLPPGSPMDDTIPWDTKTVPFIPWRIYTHQEQNTVIHDEERIHHKQMTMQTAYIQTPWGPLPAQLLEMLMSALDIREASSPPQSIDDGVDPSPPRALEVDGRYGNDVFGTEYSVNSNLSITRQPSGLLRLKAEARIAQHATVFGYRAPVINSNMTVTSEGSKTQSQVRVVVMGRTVHSRDFSGAVSRDFFEREYTYFKRTKVFMVGPVPMSVQATVTGTVAMSATVNLGLGGFSMTSGPSGSVQVAATAAVNVLVLSFGITGSLRLIGLGITNTSHLYAINSQVDWGQSIDREISTLDGTISLFSRVRFIFYTRRWNVTIARWRGLRQNRRRIRSTGGWVPAPAGFSSIRSSLVDYGITGL